MWNKRKKIFFYIYFQFFYIYLFPYLLLMHYILPPIFSSYAFKSWVRPVVETCLLGLYSPKCLKCKIKRINKKIWK